MNDSKSLNPFNSDSSDILNIMEKEYKINIDNEANYIGYNNKIRQFGLVFIIVYLFSSIVKHI